MLNEFSPQAKKQMKAFKKDVEYQQEYMPVDDLPLSFPD